MTPLRLIAALIGLLLSAASCTTPWQTQREATVSSSTPTSTTTPAPPTTRLTTTSAPATTIPAIYVTVPEFHTEVDLTLEPGEVSMSFEFQAPNPATHFFDVIVVMPIGTDLRVFFETAKGGTLHIFKGMIDSGDCATEAAEMRCLMHFPTLEAQGYGVWTALVNKLSEPAADISISIIWMTQS
jgi:hypothetical protein